MPLYHPHQGPVLNKNVHDSGIMAHSGSPNTRKTQTEEWWIQCERGSHCGAGTKEEQDASEATEGHPQSTKLALEGKEQEDPQTPETHVTWRNELMSREMTRWNGTSWWQRAKLVTQVLRHHEDLFPTLNTVALNQIGAFPFLAFLTCYERMGVAQLLVSQAWAVLEFL